MAQRIPSTTLSGNFADGEILRGWQLNKVVEVLKAGVNLNKSDIDKILLGGESDFVFATKEIADAYLSENDAPEANQYALVMAGGLDGTIIDVYKYVGGVWELQVDEVFSIFYAYTTARDIDDRVSQLELDVPALQTAIEDGTIVHDKVSYNTTVPAPSLSIGETRWNAEVETLETRVGNDVYLQHGQELVFKCKNAGGVNIPNGTPVYIIGASGSSPNFYIARASSVDYVKTSRCIGLTTEYIDAGAWGKVCVIGIVNGLNTNNFEVGDVVYLGAGGIITTVRPTTNVLALGVVIQKSTTQGRIALRPIFFPRPEDLSTVHYSGLANGDILVKDATGWKNYALANKANVSDLTAGTITVRKAEQDKDGNAIGTTYVKVSGVNAMTGNLNLGTNKIINLVDGVANQDGATIKNIDTKITAHDGSETAHLYIRELIEALEQEIERLDGRGKSYGEIAYTTAQLLALSQEILDDTITDAVALGHGGTGYTPSNGDLVYDTGVGAGVSYHEWEFNGTNWVDNGLIGYSKASNTIYGMIKGDETYLSVVSGLVQVLKSDYADKIGTSDGSYTYAQLLSAFNDRYTKAEVDALLDALKTAFGWEETDLGTYSAPVDLSSYDLVVLKYESEEGVSTTAIFAPSEYAQTDAITLVVHDPYDDSVLSGGSLLKGETTWSYVNFSGENTLSMRGYKIKPIQAENVVYDNSTSGLTADDVNGAIDEIKEDLDLKEIASNKVSAFQETPDDTHYASEKLVKDSLDAKVDKVDGKGLSENDFTNEKSAQIETNKTDIATNLANQALIDSRQDLRLATIEENLRKSMANEIQGTASGTGIVSLGKDVANAPLQVKVDGGLMDSDNQLSLVSGTQDGLTITVVGNQITINGTASADTSIALASGLTIGNKAYVNYDFISGTGSLTLNDGTALHSTYNADYSGVVTLATTSLTLEIASGQAFSSLIIKININKITALISVKQYSPFYNNTFDLMTDEQIKAQMDLWVQNGTLPNDNVLAVSMNKRVRSVGKNLFDKSQYATSYAYKIKVKPSTAYVWSSSTAYKTYDINMVEVASGTATTFTTGSGTYYIAFSGISNIDTFQLELGSTATTYEAYVSSDLFLQANAIGYQLPNLVKDTIEYRNGKYYMTKRVLGITSITQPIPELNGHTLQEVFENPTFVYNKLYTDTTGTFLDIVDNVVIANNKYYARIIIEVIGGSYNNVRIESRPDGLPSISYYNSTNIIWTSKSNETHIRNYGVNAVSFTGSFRIEYYNMNVNGISSLTVEEMNAWYNVYVRLNNGETFIYQLATPITTEIFTFGNLNGYPNGTVYIDDVMQDADIYATNATITNTDYPIKTLEKIVKINSDGSQTNLAVSGATMASGGLSFTHSSLTSGDKVWFSYVYDVANLFKSTSIITFYDNKFVIADTANGKIYKWAVTSTNGVASIALTEV